MHGNRLAICVMLGGISVAFALLVSCVPRKDSTLDKLSRSAPPAPIADVDTTPVPDGALLRLGSGRFRHASAVAFSPDGHLISTGQDLWDARTGSLLGRLQSDFGFAGGNTFTHDSRELIVNTWPVQTHGWQTFDVRTGTRTGAAFGLPFFADLAIAPNGKTAITAEEDLVVRDVTTLTEIRHLGRYQRVAFLDPNTIVAAGDKNEIDICDFQSGAVRRQLIGHRSMSTPDTSWSGIEHLACSADGRWVASSGVDGTTRLWDPANGRELACLPAGGPCAFSNAAAALFAASTPEGHITVYRLPDVRAIRQINAFDQSIGDMRFSPNAEVLGTCGTGSRTSGLRLWDVQTGAERFPATGHTGRALALAASHDGSRVASGGIDRTVRIWDLATGTEARRLDAGSGEVWAVSWSADDRTLAACSDDGIHVWAAETGALLQWACRGQRVFAGDISPDGRHVAAFTGKSGEGSVQVLDASTGSPQSTWKTGEHVRQVRFTPDGSGILLADQDQLRSVNCSDGAERWSIRMPSPVEALAFVAEGKLLEAGAHDVLVLDPRTGVTVESGWYPGGFGGTPVFSRDGMELAAAFGHWAYVFGLPEQRVISAFEAGSDVEGLAFTPDADRLVSSDDDGELLVWNVGDQRPPRNSQSQPTPAESHGAVEFQLHPMDSVKAGFRTTSRQDVAGDPPSSYRRLLANDGAAFAIARLPGAYSIGDRFIAGPVIRDGSNIVIEARCDHASPTPFDKTCYMTARLPADLPPGCYWIQLRLKGGRADPSLPSRVNRFSGVVRDDLLTTTFTIAPPSRGIGSGPINRSAADDGRRSR